MWLPGHVKQLQQDATPCFALSLRVQVKALLVTPDGWFYDRVLLNLKKRPFVLFCFCTLSKEESMLSIGRSSIVSAIKAECSQCCSVLYNSAVSVGASCLLLEGAFSGGRAACRRCAPCLLLGGYSSPIAFLQLGQLLAFQYVWDLLYYVNFGGDESRLSIYQVD